MRCERCGFHNLPGTATCMSCRAALGAPAAPVSRAAITPPRATPWKRLWSRAFRRPMPRVRVPEWVRDLSPRHLAAGFVPGLPQLLSGERRRAAWLAGAWGAAILGAAHWFGSDGFAPWLGAAIAVHSTSALLPYRRALTGFDLRSRALIGVATALTLVLALYMPLLGLVRRWAEPIGIVPNTAMAGSLESGDVLLVKRTNAAILPARGAIVAVDGVAGGVTVIDRVLGLPGDRLQKKDGVLTRNGVELSGAEGPLSPGGLPDGLDVEVPAGSFFLWPSVGFRVYGNVPVPFVGWGVHPVARLRGEAWAVYHPVAHRRWLRTP